MKHLKKKKKRKSLAVISKPIVDGPSSNKFLIDDWADKDSNMSDESVNKVMKNLKEIMGDDEFEQISFDDSSQAKQFSLMCMKSPTKSILADETVQSPEGNQGSESKLQSILSEFTTNFKDKWLPSLSIRSQSPDQNSDENPEERPESPPDEENKQEP